LAVPALSLSYLRHAFGDAACSAWHDRRVSDRGAGWESWLDALEQPDRETARWLRSQFETLGADDPESWARSQVEEGLPHLARYALLRSLWTECIDGWAASDALEQLPAAARLLEAGADRADWSGWLAPRPTKLSSRF
jgi:hypothetical protein